MRRHNGDTSLTISKHAALEGHSALPFGIFEAGVEPFTGLEPTPWLTALSWLATIYMSIGITSFLVAYKRFESKLLYYQSAYMATFYLIMILATYFHL